MDESTANRWAGKSAEDVLTESYHEIRNPVSLALGFLNVLKSADQLSLSAEEIQGHIESAFRHALRVQTIVDSVFQYMNETRQEP